MKDESHAESVPPHTPARAAQRNSAKAEREEHEEEEEEEEEEQQGWGGVGVCALLEAWGAALRTPQGLRPQPTLATAGGSLRGTSRLGTPTGPPPGRGAGLGASLSLPSPLVGSGGGGIP